MSRNVLNITNGDCFNGYFISHFGGVAVPFCEAVIDGDVVDDIYSDQFVALRARSLGVTESQYRSKMRAYDALNKGGFTDICLWFGKDTFCQVNLVTMLAYLEQIGFDGNTTLNYIDDRTFKTVEADIDVKLGGYRELYCQILIEKIMPKGVGVLSKKAIELYFDYHSRNGRLVSLARSNKDKCRKDLLKLLQNEGEDYGLTISQLDKIISTALQEK